MRSFILWCYCVQVVPTVQWHNLPSLHSPKFRFGGDTWGLQLWVLEMMLCYSYACVQAVWQTLLALWASEQLQFILFYIWLQKRWAFSFLSSPGAANYCKNVWRMSGLVLEDRRKEIWSVAWCKKMRHKLKSDNSAFYFLFTSSPVPTPRFLCQKRWQKYL